MIFSEGSDYSNTLRRGRPGRVRTPSKIGFVGPGARVLFKLFSCQPVSSFSGGMALLLSDSCRSFEAFNPIFHASPACHGEHWEIHFKHKPLQAAHDRHLTNMSTLIHSQRVHEF